MPNFGDIIANLMSNPAFGNFWGQLLKLVASAFPANAGDAHPVDLD